MEMCGSDLCFSKHTDSIYQMRAPVIKLSSVKGGGNLISQEKSGPMNPPPIAFSSRCFSALPTFPLRFILLHILEILGEGLL